MKIEEFVQYLHARTPNEKISSREDFIKFADSMVALTAKFAPSARKSPYSEVLASLTPGVQVGLAMGGKDTLLEFVTNAENEAPHDCNEGAMCPVYLVLDTLIYLGVCEAWEFGGYMYSAEADYKAMLQGVRTIGNYRSVMGLK